MFWDITSNIFKSCKAIKARYKSHKKGATNCWRLDECMGLRWPGQRHAVQGATASCPRGCLCVAEEAGRAAELDRGCAGAILEAGS